MDTTTDERGNVMPQTGDRAWLTIEVRLSAFWDDDIKGGAWVLDREAKLDSLRPDHGVIKSVEPISEAT